MAGALAAPILIPVIAVGVAVGAVGAGGLAWLATRGHYRYGIRKAEEALGTLLQAIDASARSKGGFALPQAPTPEPPRG